MSHRSSPGFSGTPSADPTGGNLQNAMDLYALEALRSPSRFDIPLVEQGTAIIDREIEQGREGATRDLDEYISSRGLVGSNVEAEERRSIGETWEDQRMRRLFDLNTAFAGTQASDRASAGHLAATTSGQQQQESQFSRSFGLQHTQLQQQESQFARGFGMDESRFSEDQRRFSSQMAEQIASRMQQETQYARSLTQEDTRLAVQSQLQTRALNLQEQGMAQDEAFRRASLEVETELRTRALNLQEQGMNEEMAYRYAALEQDGDFRTRAQELQEQGMNMDEAYRQAQLEYQGWATEQGLIQRQYETEEQSRLSELDIISRLPPGSDVPLPPLGSTGPPEITAPPGREPPVTPPVTPPGTEQPPARDFWEEDPRVTG